MKNKNKPIQPFIIAMVINRPDMALTPNCADIRQEVVKVIMTELAEVDKPVHPERHKKLIESLKILGSCDDVDPLLLQRELPLYF